MLHAGKQSVFPKIQFIQNRLKIESEIVKGLKRFSRAAGDGDRSEQLVVSPWLASSHHRQGQGLADPIVGHTDDNIKERKSRYKDESRYTIEMSEDSASASVSASSSRPQSPGPGLNSVAPRRASSQLFEEMRRQSAVFFDDDGDMFDGYGTS